MTAPPDRRVQLTRREMKVLLVLRSGRTGHDVIAETGLKAPLVRKIIGRLMHLGLVQRTQQGRTH